MIDFAYNDCDYCRYGFNYRKRTRIWSNVPGLSLLKCNKQCGKMVGRRHLSIAQRGTDAGYSGSRSFNLAQLGSIPEGIVRSIVEAVGRAMDHV